MENQDCRKKEDGKDGENTHPGDEKLGGYHACGTTHEANSTDKFLDGYYIMKGSDRPQNVIVWRGPKGDNTHCTTNLNMKEWATAKS